MKMCQNIFIPGNKISTCCLKIINMISVMFHSSLSVLFRLSRAPMHLIQADLTLFYLFPPLHFKSLSKNRFQLVFACSSLTTTQSVQCCFVWKAEEKRSPGIHLGKKQQPGFTAGFSCSVTVQLNARPHRTAVCCNPDKWTLTVSACSTGLPPSPCSSAAVSGVLISAGTAQCSSRLSQPQLFDRNRKTTARSEILGP